MDRQRYTERMKIPLDVVVIGETLVDFVPHRRGALRSAALFEMHSGGAPAKVANHAARHGVKSALVSVVGDDEFGAFLLARLAAEGVDTKHTEALLQPPVHVCGAAIKYGGSLGLTRTRTRTTESARRGFEPRGQYVCRRDVSFSGGRLCNSPT